ncbi:phage virion morphogenesis protein [Roseobacter denitrificans]|uniref:Phage virion morphogenesis protein, putative n=1 Tax=Roseobacter denitrificans (strain ATCC 33942 / OCh 114) TaxID=375451 RepID=Q16D73_ROSDO|nr:phage virion morphogenesis protein [Roseobacter denitrificans]ABG30070.1 phage virion morphogenesis protein, putative [Roseobacter denitrificans OCh 114]AVL53267.1 phage virion morphogenesis protein [Roseobacter denitrificans]SFF69252.1 phage virion morphogenesis (putative tail completion) protein [Roseobacter denitrificans OCh 114]
MIEIQIDQDEIREALLDLGEKLNDMTPVFQNIGEALLASTEDRFREGVSPDGVPWAPKSQTTIDAYTAKGFAVDFRPLWGTNPKGTALRDSLFFQAGPDYAEIATGQAYSAAMQFGAQKGEFTKSGSASSVPWGDIPARPFLGVSDEDEHNILADLKEWLDVAT